MSTMQIRQANIAADIKRLDDKRNKRLMEAPDMTQLFAQPYVVERPASLATKLIVTKRMTYAQADALACETAEHFIGPLQMPFDEYVETLFLALVAKHIA